MFPSSFRKFPQTPNSLEWDAAAAYCEIFVIISYSILQIAKQLLQPWVIKRGGPLWISTAIIEEIGGDRGTKLVTLAKDPKNITRYPKNACTFHSVRGQPFIQWPTAHKKSHRQLINKPIHAKEQPTPRKQHQRTDNHQRTKSYGQSSNENGGQQPHHPPPST